MRVLLQLDLWMRVSHFKFCIGAFALCLVLNIKGALTFFVCIDGCQLRKLICAPVNDPIATNPQTGRPSVIEELA